MVSSRDNRETFRVLVERTHGRTKVDVVFKKIKEVHTKMLEACIAHLIDSSRL